MRRTDHILAITSALLTSSKEQFDASIARITDVYELKEPRKPNAVSLGVVVNNQEQSFDHWLKETQEKTVVSVSFFYYSSQQQDLAPHMAAAFAGSSDLLMEVKTKTDSKVFKLVTYFSPSYEILPQQFIEVLNAQPDQQLVWSRASDLILQSNKLNNLSVFNSEETREYLQTQEGGHVFGYLVSDLIKEIQIECSINNQTFIIPEAFKSLFVKHQPFGFEDDRDYVYLYNLLDVTAEDILTLAEAQSFEPEIWGQLNTFVAEWQDETMPPMPVEQWKGKIMSYDHDMLQRIVNHVCRSIAKLCEDKKLLPVIPETLAKIFGPNEEDRKRANARSKGEKDRWSLQSTKQPWEYYAFRELDVDRLAADPDATETRLAFEKALREIQAFAKEIGSPFEGAFLLALFILHDLKTFDPEQVEKQLLANNSSEHAVDVMKRQLWMAEQFGNLGFSNDQIKGLMALSVADVFGGMGSWNDQYVENDYERYQAVSAKLYQVMKDYSAVIISSPRS